MTLNATRQTRAVDDIAPGARAGEEPDIPRRTRGHGFILPVDNLLGARELSSGTLAKKCNAEVLDERRPKSFRRWFCRRSPRLPDLTPETWELLEHRMWSKFRTKQWAAVGGFLTICAVLGVLGAGSHIDMRVARELETERTALRQASEDLKRDSTTAAMRARLATYVLTLVQNDSLVFAEAVSAARQQADASISKELGYSTDAHASVINTLTALGNETLETSEYAPAVRSLTKTLARAPVGTQRTNESAPLGSADWEAFDKACTAARVKQLSNVVRMYAHLQALHSAAMQARTVILQEDLGGAFNRTQLYEEYEKVVVPAYQSEWNNYHMDFDFRWTSGRFGWSTLPTLARNAFRAEETQLHSGKWPVF